MSREPHQLSKTLKQLMIEYDIDDVQLSYATGVPFTTIARMRAKPNCNPTVQSLRPVAAYFGVCISQLLGDEPLLADKLQSQKADSVYLARTPLISWKDILPWIRAEKAAIEPISEWVTVDLPISHLSFATRMETCGFPERYTEKTILIADPLAEPTSGDMVFIQLEREDPILLKRIIFDGKHAYLRSIYSELTEITTLTKPYHLCGVIIEIRQQLHTVGFTKSKPTIECEEQLSSSMTEQPE